MRTALDRRSFLKSAVLGGAAFSVLYRRAAAADGMFVSLNSSLTRQMDWKDFAQLAARVGYGGVDVNLSAAMMDGSAATLALLSGLKIKPGVTSLPVRYTNPDPGVYQGDLRQLEDFAKIAAEIGCPRMMAVLPPSSQTPKAELRTILKDRLLPVADTLARANIRLGLEFLGPL